MKKQTAVEWLGYELNTKLFYNITPELWEQVNEIFNQAKAMEREQIVMAHGRKVSRDIEHGIDVYTAITGEQYYNETYGGEQ